MLLKFLKEKLQKAIMDYKELNHHLAKLNEIGIALSQETNLTNLLELILQEARSFTKAEAGSLYIVDSGKLHFAVSQNDFIKKRDGAEKEKSYQKFSMNISKNSLAGYVAVTGEILLIDDVYNLSSDKEYKFNKDFDEENNYRTKSMLLVPMKIANKNKDVVGVLQLINALNDSGEVIPFDKNYKILISSLASQAAVALCNAKLTSELKAAYLDTIFRLSIAAEFKDEDTSAHIKRMSNYSQIISKELGLPNLEVENILYASPMHDIGKIGISDNILLKPGKLTADEFQEIKKHPIIGAQILTNSTSEVLQLAEIIALTHHEKFDGSGYPYRLKGKQIPLSGRIVAIADVFDALTSRRCYKPPFTLGQSINIIKEGSNKHFDPEVVEAFLSSLDEILKVKDKYAEQEKAKDIITKEKNNPL